MADETQILTVADDGTTASLSTNVNSNQSDLIHGLTVPSADQTLLATIQNQVTATSQTTPGTDVMSTSEAASNLIHLASLGIPPQQQQQLIIAAHQHMLQQIQAGLAASSSNGQETANTVTSGYGDSIEILMQDGAPCHLVLYLNTTRAGLIQ